MISQLSALNLSVCFFSLSMSVFFTFCMSVFFLFVIIFFTFFLLSSSLLLSFFFFLTYFFCLLLFYLFFLFFFSFFFFNLFKIHKTTFLNVCVPLRLLVLLLLDIKLGSFIYCRISFVLRKSVFSKIYFYINGKR